MPTIDVEGVHGAMPFEQMILGDFGDSESWGVFRQAKIFNKYGISATFFVDVYEYTLWGNRKLSDLCRKLLDMGQDVQLHTHPGWRDDPRDSVFLREYKRAHSYLGTSHDLMAKLQYKQQKEVLEKGIDLLQGWTGCRPIAHRSGGYSINDETIAALAAVGILVDSSMNAFHRNSITSWSVNSIVMRDGILELPITYGCYAVPHPFFRESNYLYKFRPRKTGIGKYSPSHFCSYIEDARRGGLAFINLFMHSYSMLDLSRGFKHMVPNLTAPLHLELTLGLLKERPDVVFTSVAELYKDYIGDPGRFITSDFMPCVRLSLTDFVKILIKRIKVQSKDYA